ncbi:hypothetical protein WR25_05843 [Diploscapter pachys]|uniref:G-protein coupled receptors family 1 profile domain-containing protein n=1 Tax=Diploscapter pachys TaxID=2018661 RepID=A0A2A2L700_9BILA|nr:hypothetical protein WR25_05843 [Diploscapter pachys]
MSSVEADTVTATTSLDYENLTLLDKCYQVQHEETYTSNRGVVLAVSLLALAFWDTILLWCAFMYYGIKNLPLRIDSDVPNMLTPWFHAFSQIANTASIWCVVAITLQRFMATRDPFRTSRSTAALQSFRSERRISFIYCSTYRRLFRMPIFLSLAAILLNFPAFFEIRSRQCYKEREGQVGIDLRPTWLRLDPTYTMYRILSRMMLITIGPNIFILCITVLTVFILKGSNRSRRQLFQMSDNLAERYASRENMQTMISVMLLDIMEVTVGAHNYYLIDTSNFLVLLNSATNCLVFLKATTWLSNRITEKQTMKRKKTICDASLLLGDRLALLCSSWRQAIQITSGQLGLRLLYAMVRKNPHLSAIFRQQNGAIEKVCEDSFNLITNGGSRRSFDIVTNPLYREVAERIVSFLNEVLVMMERRDPEHLISLRIRRVGAVHFDKGVQLSSAVWKEFKCCMLTIISECEFASQVERDTALDAWNIFISYIIREMKMGTWAVCELP